jgi:beta-glucanase (GH16 family)
MAVHPLFGAELFRDDFNQASLNTSAWGIGTWTLGRTQLGFTPQLTGGMARLRLDTYNPTNPGGSFKGTEIWTNAQYSRGTNGLEMEARVRVNTEPDGLVTSFFTYAARTQFSPPLADEIDFEHVSKTFNAAAAGSKPILLTTWNDYRTDGSNFGDPNVHNSASVVVGGLDLTQFNTYRIRWLGNRVEWYVNDKLVRTATQAVATDPQNVRLNFWAPGSDWPDAYSSAIAPTASAAANKTYLYDVDFVSIRDAYNPVSTTAANRVFTDHFKNGTPSNSDSVTGFWSTRNLGTGTVTETTADPLKLSVSGAGYPHAQVASAVRSEFNLFTAPLRITADGIDFATTTGSEGKSILRFVLSPQTLSSGSESEYTVEDALSLRIQADNSIAFGYKLDQANTNSEYNNLLLSTTLSGPVRRFTLTVNAAVYTLAIEHETSSTDGTRVVDTFTGNLNLSLSKWRTGTASPATGNSAMFIQGQFNNSLASESMTAMVDSLSVDAVKSSWAADANGTWSATGSWSVPDGVPNFSGANVVLGSVLSVPRTVAVDGAVTAGVLQFNSAKAYTLSGAGRLTMRTPASGANIDVLAGSHVIAVPLTLSANTTVTVTGGSVLTVGSVSADAGVSLIAAGPGRLEAGNLAVDTVSVTGGTLRILANGGATGLSVVKSLSIAAGNGALLDLVDNHLIVRQGSETALRQLVATWYAGGARNGGGIGSSLATAGSYGMVAVFPNEIYPGGPAYFTTYDGTSVASGDVIVRYTYGGDVNLDGMLDGRDLKAVMEGLVTGQSGWAHGDVNYDGRVTAEDVQWVMNALQAHLPPLGNGTDASPGGTAQVPEVSGWCMAGLLLIPAGRRRR